MTARRLTRDKLVGARSSRSSEATTRRAASNKKTIHQYSSRYACERKAPQTQYPTRTACPMRPSRLAQRSSDRWRVRRISHIQLYIEYKVIIKNIVSPT